MVNMNLQYFGGRGSGGGKGGAGGGSAKVEGKSEATEKEVITKGSTTSTAKKSLEEKQQAYSQKISNLKETMTNDQLKSKWNGIVSGAPERTEIYLNGRNWENTRRQTIYAQKTGKNSFQVQWSSSSEPRTYNTKEMKNLIGGNMLSNYYVGSVDISTPGKSHTFKSIQLKRKK